MIELFSLCGNQNKTYKLNLIMIIKKNLNKEQTVMKYFHWQCHNFTVWLIKTKSAYDKL